ncbi:hypothetical protein [uncultured Algibacter sp.]|uniref:hypothetical protein n=1 Tax=uncultured Algibacter sp. TaxID=298659 RepID=UPI00261AF0C3|nr:hypothetical protein [uncultured Algibacter sp.]
MASIEDLQDLLDSKVDSASLRPTVFINNNPVNTKTLVVNDYVLDDFWDATEYWSIAIALGTDKDTKGNWNVLEST